MSSEKAYLLGIDIGTESSRVALVDTSGKVVSSSQKGYDLSCPRPGWAEQDPEMWWSATVYNIKKVLEENLLKASQIAAVGSAGQMHAPVPVNDQGQLLSNNVLLWCDKRSDPICTKLEPSFTSSDAIHVTGNPAVAAWTGFKMKWLKENLPEQYHRTAKFLSCNGFINYKLTGQMATDYSEASGTFLFDAVKKRWSIELCEQIGVDKKKLPEIVDSSQVVGKVTSDAAKITGLMEGTPVVAGGGDMLCLLLGAGIVSSGMACDIGGTASDVSVYSKEPIYDRRLMNLHHVVPGGWISFGILDSGAFKWFKDEFCTAEKAEALRRGISPYDLLTDKAAGIRPGSEGLIFLPYLLGERTLGTSASRAVFFGLTPRHSIAHCTRAIMEGIVFDLRQTLDIITEKGITVDTIRSVGGSAKSPLWCQIKADIYQRKLLTLSNFEGGVMGTIILAALGAGLYQDVSSAAMSMLQLNQVFTPEPRTVEQYNRCYRVFKQLHDGLQPYFKRLAAIYGGDSDEC